jgi:hypothetical protein
MPKEGGAIHVAQNLFSKEPASYGGMAGAGIRLLGRGSNCPRDYSFYASYRYWYKRGFFAWHARDVFVFSVTRGAVPHRPNFGISVCFQLIWG